MTTLSFVVKMNPWWRYWNGLFQAPVAQEKKGFCATWIILYTPLRFNSLPLKSYRNRIGSRIVFYIPTIFQGQAVKKLRGCTFFMLGIYFQGFKLYRFIYQLAPMIDPPSGPWTSRQAGTSTKPWECQEAAWWRKRKGEDLRMDIFKHRRSRPKNVGTFFFGETLSEWRMYGGIRSGIYLYFVDPKCVFHANESTLPDANFPAEFPNISGSWIEFLQQFWRSVVWESRPYLCRWSW